MADVREIQTTFKDLQADQRYKKLKRALKMVLLKDAQGKNAERQNIAHDNTNKWPSVSTINRANLDASCTTISNQSCTTSTEIVSASANMRNIMFNKSQFDTQNKIPFATSSERQFPVGNDHDNDSAMMPPPRTPGIDFGQLKKFNRENNCHPLVNTETCKEKNNSGLSPSLSTSNTVNSSKTTGLISTTSSGIIGNHSTSDSISQSPYGKVKSNSQSTERKERIFHKWTVLLNDQGQLIIKGTLECGKLARSKPVLKRLTCTSVKSIYKCIYHLVGNLVDERRELPDYVSEKFYNGFPDNWENVLQLWRNYISDGRKLSFRWPTPVTDSDDDLRSDVTDISYCQKLDNYKKSRLPRKRTKTLKTPCKNTLSPTDSENHIDHTNSDHPQTDIHKIPIEKSLKPLENVSQSSSKNPHHIESLKVSAKDKTETSHKMFNVSPVTSEITDGTSLKDIVQEELHTIINNLTNKNCSIDYINKMAVMLDCMKYFVPYQSTDTDGSDMNDRSNSMKQSSRTPDKQGPVMEDENNPGSPLQYSPVNSVRSRNRSGDISHDNRKVDSQNIAENLEKVQHTSKVRRKLSKHDYDDSESDTDYHDDMRKTMNSNSTSYERNRSCQNCKDCKILSTAMTSKMQFHSTKRPLDGSYESEKHVKNYSARKKKYDSRFTDETLEIDETPDSKEVCGGEFVNPRTCRGNKGTMENFRRKEANSSYSITEDEEESYRDTTRVKETKGEQYGSDISTTEDEHRDTRNGGKLPDGFKHYCDSRPCSTEMDTQRRRNDRIGRNKMESLKRYGELKTHPVDSDIRRNASGPKNCRKPPTYDESVVYENNSGPSSLSNRTSGKREDNKCRSPDEPVAELHGNLNRLSSHTTRQKNIDANRQLAKTDSIRKCTTSRAREIDFQCNSNTFLVPPEMVKNSRATNKPAVVTDEIVNINIKTRKCQDTNENDKNLVKMKSNRNHRSETTAPSVEAINNPNGKMLARVVLEHIGTSKFSNAKSTTKEMNALDVDTLDYKVPTCKTNSANIPKLVDNVEGSSVGQFGSKDNPKPLSTWIPVVNCDDDDSKCRLLFNGKLLNEAGHTLYRTFSTDFVKRRWTSKLIQTDDGVFYKLTGEMKDTKHVVPKELINLCHDGCPSDIRYFCERWKSYSTEAYNAPSKPHNVAVDSLNVPTSSRGRRILPPLNYWAGERISTKGGGKVIYDPGNCEEHSLPSLLDISSQETMDRRKSRNAHLSPSAGAHKVDGNRMEDTSVNATKKKDVVKVSSPISCKPFTKKTEQSGRPRVTSTVRNQRRTRLIQISSESEDSEPEKTTPILRKKHDSGEDANTRILRGAKRVTPSFETLEPSMHPQLGSSEDSDDYDIQQKLRKRLKTVENEREFDVPTTSKQLPPRRFSRLLCTRYKNLPSRDSDFSDDQLSTI